MVVWCKEGGISLRLFTVSGLRCYLTANKNDSFQKEPNYFTVLVWIKLKLSLIDCQELQRR